MNRLTILLLFFINSSFALELPEAGEFSIKNLEDKNILYVLHEEANGHISNSLVKLVQYYLINESDSYNVIFPQFSIDSNRISETYYAIEYEGKAQALGEVKTTKLAGGNFASYIYQGSYTNLSKVIPTVFKKIIETKKYIPHKTEEVRLLYWNSIDDNHPEALITEIQVKVRRR